MAVLGGILKHHLIKKKTWHMEHEDSERIKCSYCGSELTELESMHERNIHYKGTVCSACGKKIWARVNFLGCGRDNLKHSELEKRIA